MNATTNKLSIAQIVSATRIRVYRTEYRITDGSYQSFCNRPMLHARGPKGGQVIILLSKDNDMIRVYRFNNSTTDIMGWTPIELAELRGQLEVVE